MNTILHCPSTSTTWCEQVIATLARLLGSSQLLQAPGSHQLMLSPKGDPGAFHPSAYPSCSCSTKVIPVLCALGLPGLYGAQLSCQGEVCSKTLMVCVCSISSLHLLQPSSHIKADTTPVPALAPPVPPR